MASTWGTTAVASALRGSWGAVSENGRLRQRAGGYPRGDRRRRGLVLPMLSRDEPLARPRLTAKEGRQGPRRRRCALEDQLELFAQSPDACPTSPDTSRAMTPLSERNLEMRRI